MNKMPPPVELPAEHLRRVCDPNSFEFETTAGLPALSGVLGQPRAVAALEFGVGIASHGFNVFALGQPGSGKTTLIRQYLEHRAATEPVPPDVCYVKNFSDARRPLPLTLPPGRASQFKHDIDAAVEELKTVIPRAFDATEYAAHRDTLLQDLEEKRQNVFSRLDQDVSDAGFKLLKGPGGLALVPAAAGKMLSEHDIERLSPEDREKISRARDGLQHEVEERLHGIREAEKDARDAVRALDTATATFATRHAFDELRDRYADQPRVVEFLESLQADVIEHLDDFRKTGEGESSESTPPDGGEKPFARYCVNVLVDNRNLTGAPVVVETNPTWYTLTGRAEHQATPNGVRTDHTLIKAGALHRANGGYLIVPARECLSNPLAWDCLKRALKDRSLRIEEPGVQLGAAGLISLDPEPVPLNVKVVLIGAPSVYYLLYAYDEDFQKLFKVKAEFTTRMERTPEAERAYALFIGTTARQENTLPFDRGAVARIIEYGSRAAEDQDQLSTRFGEIADLIREAADGAARNSHNPVTGEDVRAAEEAQRYRQNLGEERLREETLKGTVLLDTSGAAVGQVNGLSVINFGDYAFGHPARITATVAPGRRGVVSIEREVELSGPIHGKGVLILSGYLLRKYGHAGPLSLSASLVFEQSYSMVDGDSASLAELCVLLSAVADVPLRQDIALTGSINQHGQVQPVGGVTQKIEGFFDLCCARGLTRTQGVIVPASNRRSLMLRDDVVSAVCARGFHVWAVETVDQALSLLTGEPDLHGRVLERLGEYARTLKALTGDGERADGQAV